MVLCGTHKLNKHLNENRDNSELINIVNNVYVPRVVLTRARVSLSSIGNRAKRIRVRSWREIKANGYFLSDHQHTESTRAYFTTLLPCPHLHNSLSLSLQDYPKFTSLAFYVCFLCISIYVHTLISLTFLDQSFTKFYDSQQSNKNSV